MKRNYSAEKIDKDYGVDTHKHCGYANGAARERDINKTTERRTDADKTSSDANNAGCVKKYVRYREGAELYSIGLTKFQELAHHAGAVHKLGGISLVNCETFERYLEQFVV